MGVEEEMSDTTILVLGGEQRSALAAVRSLGAKGLDVVVGSFLASSLAGKSKFASGCCQYTSPDESVEQFLADVLRCLNKFKAKWLLPVTDMSLYAILANRGRLPAECQVLSPEFKKYWSASDKISLVKLAQENGVPVPKTRFCTGADVEYVARSFGFPFVLKPQSSIIEQGHRLENTSVKIIYNEAELFDVLRDSRVRNIPCMIQEKINGEGIGIFAVFENGEARAVFSHRRIREKPPWGGVSVLCESCAPDPLAKSYAFKLLKALDWHGVAMVEFKRDNRDGLPNLMEINARLWGSLQLAIDAGVDFPYLMWRLFNEESLQVTNTNASYARLRWLLGDVDNLFISVKTAGNLWSINNSTRRFRAFCNFIKEFRAGAQLQVFRRDDIGPFLWELAHYFGRK